MPRKCNLSWDSSRPALEKMIFGRRYVVSCLQLKRLGYLPLSAPDTKEQSYQAANQWLRDQLNAQPTSRHQWIIDKLESRAKCCDQEGDDAQASIFLGAARLDQAGPALGDDDQTEGVGGTIAFLG